jgi:hypothetical protein
MAKRKISKLRRFNLPWGQGDIVEEASFAGEYHESRIQLLKADEGYVMVRFCYYDLDGRFQRSPLIVGEDDLKGLKVSMRKCPQLRALLKTLAG